MASTTPPDIESSAVVAMLDEAIRSRLAEKYCNEIGVEIDKLVCDLKARIKDGIEEEVKVVTLDQIRRDFDVMQFADRLLVAILVNPKKGVIISDSDTTLIEREA
jgi:hypothetical protein